MKTADVTPKNLGIRLFSLGDLMRLVGQYVDADSHEVRRSTVARGNLLHTYRQWCDDGQPEVFAAWPIADEAEATA